jgi:hypothetical protein
MGGSAYVIYGIVEESILKPVPVHEDRGVRATHFIK